MSLGVMSATGRQDPDINKSTLSASDSVAAGDGSLRVLVAEDNPVNQLLVQTLLHLGGHSCQIVANGAAAVAAVQEQDFDVVLMDVRMPEMSGIEASRAIRALGGVFSSLPIIAMTANSSPEDAEECASAGMNDYMPKPIDRAAFYQKLSGLRA